MATTENAIAIQAIASLRLWIPVNYNPSDWVMRIHPITPRKKLRKGREKWCVHVPDDLWQKGLTRDFQFSREEDAKAKARELTKSRGNLAGKFMRLKQDEQAEALRDWEAKKNAAGITVAKACEKCLLEKATALRANSLSAARITFKSMITAFGSRPLASVEADDVKAWLALHPEWSPKTILNNLKYAASLFNWGINNRLLTYNPCKGVLRPAVPFKAVKILTVAQIRQLLKTCCEEDPALLPFIGLVLYGGLRVAEARRCKGANLVNGVIDLGGESCKLNERRCVTISAQLAAWIANHGEEIDVPNFANRMKHIQNLSCLVIPQNALRHSFCSYHLAVMGSEATARAANNSPSMLFKHYASLVSKKDAQEFFTIMPENCCKNGVECENKSAVAGERTPETANAMVSKEDAQAFAGILP